MTSQDIPEPFKWEQKFATFATITKAGYSELANHKGAHNAFLTKLKGLSAPRFDDDFHYAKNWLVQHILTIDFKYKRKL